MNKAGYTAQDAYSLLLKISRDGATDGATDGPTDGRTNTTSYRDATAHLKKSAEGVHQVTSHPKKRPYSSFQKTGD